MILACAQSVIFISFFVFLICSAVSTFWIANPHNNLINCAAAGSEVSTEVSDLVTVQNFEPCKAEALLGTKPASVTQAFLKLLDRDIY